MTLADNPQKLDLAFLLLRLQVGILMLTHGIPKLLSYSEKMDSFADPFGLGSPVSLALAIFAEVFCSILLILGFKIRLALIPLIVTMLVAVFIASWDKPFGRKELGLMYLLPYFVLMLTGPGKYSLDGILDKKA